RCEGEGRAKKSTRPLSPFCRQIPSVRYTGMVTRSRLYSGLTGNRGEEFLLHYNGSASFKTLHFLRRMRVWRSKRSNSSRFVTEEDRQDFQERKWREAPAYHRTGMPDAYCISIDTNRVQFHTTIS